MSQPPVCIAALYRFTPFADPAALRASLLEACLQHGIRGTLLLAREGINGTIAGSAEGIESILAHIRGLPGCDALEWKLSWDDAMPFNRMKVRLKREIVTMGQPDIDPLAGVGRYVPAAEWNALISDPDTILIDTRNNYEVAVGTFKGAIDPDIQSFREFPDWFRGRRAALEAEGRKPKIAMFCTGGIRCEKSTAFALSEGVEDVYHLKGGILKYLEDVPEAESLWEGECFVFDQRVTVRHGLEPGAYDLCHACRRPVSAQDKTSPLFIDGIQCPACAAERTDEQRARYAARQHQEDLARARGTHHIGGDA
ncbi:oxygen-dependent tRNA uridine(34) hydroxylase TrhO [Asaia bogorensis]|nr:rhodanese-related sulfurtransferase [Asaia bogorensis]